METKVPVNVAQVVAWGSVIFGFGLVQGAIYLTSFWSRFQLEPFQFGDVSDLAVGGLIGFGVTLGFISVAAMFGSILGRRLGVTTQKYQWLIWALLVLVVAGLIALIACSKFGVYLVGGVVLSWVLLALVKASPDLPDSFKALVFLPYLAMAVVYVPFCAYQLGQRHADSVTQGRRGGLVEESLTGTPSQRFVGRLGDVYVFLRVDDGAVILKPVSSAGHITILRNKI